VADVMGLGKTLTMLSAVICSKNAATEFAKIDSCRTRARPTRATLIVVTSRRKPHPIPSSNIMFSPFSYPDVQQDLHLHRGLGCLDIRD